MTGRAKDKVYRSCLLKKEHPCDINKGGCSQLCVKVGENMKCACNKGFILTVGGRECIPGMCFSVLLDSKYILGGRFILMDMELM